MVEISKRIEQVRMDALCAIYLHTKKLNDLQRISQITDWMGIVLPICSTGLFPLFDRNGWWHRLSIYTTAILSTGLLILSVTKILRAWEDKIKRHSMQRAENIAAKNEALKLMNKTEATEHDVAAFFKSCEGLEKLDKELLGSVKSKTRQKAYKEALKEFRPGVSTPCPSCKKDPYNSLKSECLLCGG